MGVQYDIETSRFEFDFKHDGQDDNIQQMGSGYQVEAFGQCFYYGYEFTEDVKGSVRTAFINHLKFPKSLRDDPELTQFIQKAVNNLHKRINLYNYDLVVTPESSSRVNEYMVRYIYRFAQPMMREMQKLFEDEIEEKFVQAIKARNILIVDDITTSGSTLNEVLRALRILNEDNKITLFSLVGRKDLMAESM